MHCIFAWAWPTAARFDAGQQAGTDSPSDFSTASHYWLQALKQNPNQYIWRRRIQQYGPRLEKPYPFYDWIETAANEIRQRGETPVPLKVPLSGAEISQPTRQFDSQKVLPNPDPDAEVNLDIDGLIQLQSVAVPASVAPGKATRIHLMFQPGHGKWNNEAEPLRVWINNAENFDVSRQLHESANGDQAVSSESRSIEFELKIGNEVSDQVVVSGFALYNTCESDNGQCLFRRMEFKVPIKIDVEK